MLLTKSLREKENLKNLLWLQTKLPQAQLNWLVSFHIIYEGEVEGEVRLRFLAPSAGIAEIEQI